MIRDLKLDDSETVIKFIKSEKSCDECGLKVNICSLLEDNGKLPLCERKGHYEVVQYEEPLKIQYERVFSEIEGHDKDDNGLYAIRITKLDEKKLPFMLEDTELNFQHYKSFELKLGNGGNFKGRKLWISRSNNYTIVPKFMLDIILERVNLINKKYKN